MSFRQRFSLSVCFAVNFYYVSAQSERTKRRKFLLQSKFVSMFCPRQTTPLFPVQRAKIIAIVSKWLRRVYRRMNCKRDNLKYRLEKLKSESWTKLAKFKGKGLLRVSSDGNYTQGVENVVKLSKLGKTINIAWAPKIDPQHRKFHH